MSRAEGWLCLALAAAIVAITLMLVLRAGGPRDPYAQSEFPCQEDAGRAAQ